MTFLSILESKFSNTWRGKAILRGKGDSRLSYSRIGEIPVSHITEMEKYQKVNLIRQSQLTDLKATENGFMLLLWWCSFQIQKEKPAGLQFTSTDYLSLFLIIIADWAFFDEKKMAFKDPAK